MSPPFYSRWQIKYCLKFLDFQIKNYKNKGKISNSNKSSKIIDQYFFKFEIFQFAFLDVILFYAPDEILAAKYV